MASEILRRNPTSTGNRRVFTWAGWVKFNKLSTVANCIWYAASSGSSEFNISLVSSTGALNVYDYAPSAYQYQYVTSRLLRDFSNWFHLVVAVDTTQFREDDRFKIYINGALYNGSYSTEITVGGINHNTRMNTPGEINTIGQNISGGVNYDANCELADMFMVDGQALTPDVFGFYKQGKGYISVGSTQATDFRPGQWVPKTPRVIKTEINRRGGFGVNGFYLPMNDSRNFGADFHTTPNSIITLKGEDLPQPKNGAPTTTDAYVSQLRSDPYAANLVLAVPGISGGQGSGYGDYSADIKGSGTNKVITANGNAGVAVTASYYGSALSFTGIAGTYFSIPDTEDFEFGRGDYTVEFWVKCQRATSGTTYYEEIVTKGWPFQIYRNNTGLIQLSIDSDTGGGYDFTGSFGTPGVGDWAHVAVSKSNGVTTLYMNGVASGIQTTNTNINNTGSNFTIGDYADSAIYPFNGYIQDLRVYKGVAKYTGGFDVPRPYTPVGIATWRAVPDTTANNFATLNSVVKSAALSDGNLTANGISAAWSGEVSTIGINTGKWYQEYYYSDLANDGSYYHGLGIRVGTGSSEDTSFRELNGEYWGTKTYNHSGLVRNNAMALYNVGNKGDILSGTFTGAHTIMQAIDASTGKCWWGIDGTWANSGNPTNGTGVSTSFTTGSYVIPTTATYNNTYKGYLNFGQNPTFSGNTTAGTFTDSNGKGLFKYQPPSGFLALCEDNLPTPAISDPGKHFKTVLYTGDSAASRSIVGVGFTPDLIWLKDRVSTNNAQIFDSVRGFGGNKELTPSQTYAEGGGSSAIYGFVGSSNNDGFSYLTGSSNPNQANYNGDGIVAWCWRAGAGTTSTNTNGSIPSVVSVNQDAGFSIVSYTGTGANATVGHGLGKAPSFIIVKNRDLGSTNFVTWHRSLTGAGQGYIFLNSTAAEATGNTSSWNSTIPSSTVLSLGASSNTNNSTNKMIAYCWAEIEGFSKFGSYVGNGNADGPMVYTGGKPAFLMIKRTDAVEQWIILDSSRASTNPVNPYLVAQASDAEGGTGGSVSVDFLSNGFKLRQTGAAINASGGTYIFACWMESPFTTANAK